MVEKAQEKSREVNPDVRERLGDGPGTEEGRAGDGPRAISMRLGQIRRQAALPQRTGRSDQINFVLQSAS